MASAEAAFAETERRYNLDAGSVLSAFVESMFQSDAYSKDMAFERTKEMLKQGNVDVQLTGRIPTLDDELSLELSIPTVTMMNLRSLEVANVNGSLDQSVHSFASDETKYSAQGSFRGHARVGWGPISVGVTIAGGTSCSGSRKRSSDRTATSHFEATCSQSEPPEGVGIIVDAANRFGTKFLSIAESVLEARMQEYLVQLFDDEQVSAQAG